MARALIRAALVISLVTVAVFFIDSFGAGRSGGDGAW